MDHRQRRKPNGDCGGALPVGMSLHVNFIYYLINYVINFLILPPELLLGASVSSTNPLLLVVIFFFIFFFVYQLDRTEKLSGGEEEIKRERNGEILDPFHHL